jgi:ribosomal protein S6--L-glutamate ligase
MRRTAPEGDFRSNLHRGGTAAPCQVTEEEESVAVRSAQQLGLGVAGVDLIRASRGPLVLEVNSTPGLEGVEAVNQTEIAERIVDYVANQILVRRACS